ncbi:hypothetical protein H5410_031094 [Solanum commersonii]|uniref:Uncharacterized protein n=1 Tax=Solanum commersonii TaxID=4109 RepID=A0A9J5YKN3_SOLCO|nr:hypothetical protein H5410_031094 [Solanum commersonii]
MHDFTIGLPLFSNKHLFLLTQDHKGLFKACNGAKGSIFFKTMAQRVGYSSKAHFMRVMGAWIKRSHNCSNFFQKKDKAQRVQERFTDLTRLTTKRDNFKSLDHLVNQTNGANSRCHHTVFKVSSSNKKLAPISNETHSS